jgi:hypothetical protein
LVVTRHLLGFSRELSYPPDAAITLPIILMSDANRRVGFTASLDTGSTYCVFERRYARLLDLELEAGVQARITTATGSFYCFGHEVTLWSCALEWQAVVYFAEADAFSLNVVGRVGFLDRLKVGIVDYEQLLYLGLYDES